MCVVSTAPPFPLGRIPTFERARMLQYSLHWMPIGLQFSIVSPNEGLFFVKKTFSQSPKAKEHARVFGEIDSKRSNTFQSLLGLQAAKSQEIRWRMEEWPATWQGQACGLEEEICGRPELRLVLRNVQVTHMPTIEPKVLTSRSFMASWSNRSFNSRFGLTLFTLPRHARSCVLN